MLQLHELENIRAIHTSKHVLVLAFSLNSSLSNQSITKGSLQTVTKKLEVKASVFQEAIDPYGKVTKTDLHELIKR